MKYGICPISVVSIRTAPAHKAEQLSQLLFGETFEVLETKGRQWCKVKCSWDDVEGWVAANQINYITQAAFEAHYNNVACSLELFQAVMGEHEFIGIPLGAQLPEFDGMRLKMGGQNFTFSGQAVFQDEIEQPLIFLLKVARRYINAPYLWGGRSPYGIDSDGLIQMIYKMAGMKLPRRASEQVFCGENIYFIEQALPGDIAFFENKNNRVTHTGLVLNDNRIMHAYGKVRIDKIDHYGIYNNDESRYTHTLRVVKRMLDHNEDLSSTQAWLFQNFEEPARTLSMQP
ncbi:MAG: SH3 domain-containing C40 family peptidase [Bacteroidota bacterium]